MSTFSPTDDVMSDTLQTPDPSPKRFWELTWLEYLLIVIIAVVLYILLSSEAEWVADGTRELPVRVFVFDVESGEPIRGAEVGIVKSPGWYELENSAEIAQNHQGLPGYFQTMPADQKGQTDERGLIAFQHEFASGSGSKHPKTLVFPGKCWVYVSSEGFRGVVISLGAADVEYGEVKRNGGFLVPIGIVRDKAP